MIYARFCLYLVGLIIFAFGISLTIKMQHLGLHPWDVLSVGMYDKFGLTIGSWSVIIGFLLILITIILDRSYVKLGTLLNMVLVGAFVDLYLFLNILPEPTYTWIDVLLILIGIVIMGIGGGLYNAAKIGAGPRDGFMLSISDKTGFSIGKVRIVIETAVLVIGLLIGGPVFIFTFIFTFVQSPIFQFSYIKLSNVVDAIEIKLDQRRSRII